MLTVLGTVLFFGKPISGMNGGDFCLFFGGDFIYLERTEIRYVSIAGKKVTEPAHAIFDFDFWKGILCWGCG
jgi:hypothetical protein